mgnify:CR=1 FL=1
MENTEAKRNIKLIAFDLDGTTLHGFAELSERNRRAMEKANDADILVVPATGRVRNFIPPCLTELPFIRYAITSNGGAVWDILENKVLCKVLGIDPKNTMAAGDNGNDLGMLKAAGFAAVVGNGIEEAKAIADAVVAPCIEDGFAEAVERFALR